MSGGAHPESGLSKSVWSDADFEEMGWHDATVHGLYVQDVENGQVLTFEAEHTVLATGGLAGVIGPQCGSIQHVEPWLTLHGLRIVYERNAP